MIIVNLILFVVSLIVLLEFAEYAIKYSSRVAEAMRFPEFVVSFFIIALISVLPEATIAIISAIKGETGLALGTLLGSNVVDLTLVFGIVTFFSSSGIKVKSKILEDNFLYLILLIFPLVLGFDGEYSRIDGIILILVGFLFFLKIYLEKDKFKKKFKSAKKEKIAKSVLLLTLSVAVILASAYFTIKFAVNFAQDIKLPKILIGITILAFGTCFPELIFSIKAVKKEHSDLALGDLLGTVITDATIILGLVAVINPFTHNIKDLFITGSAMFIGGILVTTFMKSDKTLKKIEGLMLILFYILFVFAEFMVNHWKMFI